MLCNIMLRFIMLKTEPTIHKVTKNGGSSPDLVAVWLFQLHSITSLHVLTIFCLCVVFHYIAAAFCQLPVDKHTHTPV